MNDISLFNRLFCSLFIRFITHRFAYYDAWQALLVLYRSIHVVRTYMKNVFFFTCWLLCFRFIFRHRPRHVFIVWHIRLTWRFIEFMRQRQASPHSMLWEFCQCFRILSISMVYYFFSFSLCRLMFWLFFFFLFFCEILISYAFGVCVWEENI